MITPSSRSINPYTGNPYLYGGGPEHNWFIDERGNVLPAPQQPLLPLPGAAPGPGNVPSLFEGDGARGGDAYTPGGPVPQDTWPDMTGPALADVLAALADDRKAGPDMRAGPNVIDTFESEPPAGWAGDTGPAPVDFADDVGMMADRAAEEIALGDRAMTRAGEFDEPPSTVEQQAPSFTDAPPAAGVSGSVTPGHAELSAPIGTGGLVGSIGTNARGWGESIGGTGPGAISGLVETMTGNMQPGNTNPAEFANSPQGRAAMDFMEGLLSRSPDEFTNFGERATLGGNRSTMAGTLDQLRGYVDPTISFAPPEPLEFVPSAPVSSMPTAPGYTPGPVAPASPIGNFLDLLDLEKTPVIDQETGVQLSSLAEPEVISQETGALGLLGVDEDMLGHPGEDLVYGGGGQDDMKGGLTDKDIIDMYNEPNIGVGQQGFAGGSLIGDLQRAVEMMDTKGTDKTRGGYNDDMVQGGYGFDPRGQPGTEYTGSSGTGNRDKQGATGEMGQGTGDNGHGNDGKGSNNNGVDAATSPDQDSTGGVGAGNSGSSGSGGCYLTTAAVDHMGLPDNGPHLQTLRWYRDKVMRKTPAGRRMIAEYNRVAPKAVKSLNGRSDAQELYKAIFSGYIDPAAKAITEGKYDKADAIYGSMVKNVASITGVE